MPSSRTIAADFSRLMNRAGAPICIFDEDRRLIFANDACATWVGGSRDDLIGHTATFSSVSGDKLAAADLLCPPPDAFGGERRSGFVFARSDGSLRRRRAEFLPLDDVQTSSGTGVMVLCAAHDDEESACDSSFGDVVATARFADDADALHARLVHFRAEQCRRYRLESLVGESPAMQLARSQAQAAIASGANATIVGPRGSGRERLARMLHYGGVSSGRGEDSDETRTVYSPPVPSHLAHFDLLPLDGSLLTADVLHSAAAALADPSGERLMTVLLLHLDRLPMELQEETVRLFVQRRPAVRILATSETSPDELLAGAGLNAQLAAATSTLVIRLPRLAERRQDIPLLAQTFIEEENAKGAKQLRGMSPAAIDALVAYSWPGDVAELRGFVSQAFARAEGFEITPADLPRRISLAAGAVRSPPRASETINLEQFLSDIERELIERALKEAKGNKTRAARLLGLARPRLYRRMVQLGLESAETTDTAAAPSRTDDVRRRRRTPAKSTSPSIETSPLDASSADQPQEPAEYIEDIPFEEQPE